mgnify:CR=1 FL=1
MRDDYKQQISALVDDELRPEESRFLMARVGSDGQARDQVASYITIRHALQGSLAVTPEGDSRHVAKEVAAALEEEPAHDAAGGNRLGRRWVQPAAGAALAAGVAAVTLALWPTPNPMSGSQRGESMAQPVAEAGSTAGARPVADGADAEPALRAAGAGAGQSGPIQPEMRQRLNSYMINHSEYAAGGGVGGVMSYVRIAGHEAADE